MPITIEILGSATANHFDDIFSYFESVDDQFSTYKPTSEVSLINKGLPNKKWSKQMKAVLDLCQQTKECTGGFFDVYHEGKLDPSGLVKGWSIHNAANILLKRGVKNFYIEAGGDIQTHGSNSAGSDWEAGIRNPFNINEIIKVIHLSGQGVATSGTYIRGQHIYNPHGSKQIHTIKSLTVVGPNIYEADRFATAAFAMGDQGIKFIEATDGLDGYSVDARGIATYTSGFSRYVV